MMFISDQKGSSGLEGLGGENKLGRLMRFYDSIPFQDRVGLKLCSYAFRIFHEDL